MLPNLKMAAGANGLLHVAWSNSAGSLYYSQVRARTLQIPGYGVSYSASVHLRRISTGGKHGGRYLPGLPEIRTRPAAGGWNLHGAHPPWGRASDTKNAYASPYFRGTKPGEGQVSLAVAGDKKVYIAWNEPVKGQVWLAISDDGGEKWSESRSMDQRQPEDGAGVSPARPYLSAMDQQVLMVWQAGHQGSECAQYSQSSQDGGRTWGISTPARDAWRELCR